ncbi:MAG: methylase domain protein [Actinomycetia bacterium]|nr:methylase domain protein [Actinomycetes bacterium]
MAVPLPLDQVLLGDVRELSRGLPAGSAHCIVTSPPYYGHRAYSAAGDPRELGREKTPQDYVDALVGCLGEAGRLLRDDGTLWLNLGDTYRQGRLLGIPWRVALALQDAGWHLRADIIWHKPNAMPSSVRTRPTTDHEYLFLLSKSASYHYDADAIREPHVTFTERSRMRGGRGHFGKRAGTPERGKNQGNGNLHDARWDEYFHPAGRNRRTVWSVPLGKFREAHFAVFPEALIEPCVKAGCPPGGVVLDPFMGSGTTAVVSRRLGRHFLGFELIPEYVELARRRLAGSATRSDHL